MCAPQSWCEARGPKDSLLPPLPPSQLHPLSSPPLSSSSWAPARSGHDAGVLRTFLAGGGARNQSAITQCFLTNIQILEPGACLVTQPARGHPCHPDLRSERVPNAKVGGGARLCGGAHLHPAGRHMPGCWLAALAEEHRHAAAELIRKRGGGGGNWQTERRAVPGD